MMNNKQMRKRGQIAPGIYATQSTSSLKSIANKSPEAYSKNIPEETEADLKRKKAEADMATSPFRVQPFISPITGRKENSSDVNVMMAHGIYEKSTGRVVESKDRIVLTQEAMANATFTMTSDVSKILASSSDEVPVSVPIQGRLVFSTMEGEFEIEANLVRVKLEESDVYAQYDRTLNDVLDEQLEKHKESKPFTNFALPRVDEPSITYEELDEALGMTTVVAELDQDHQQMPVVMQQEIVETEDVSPKIAHKADVVTEVDTSSEIAHEADVVTEVDASPEIAHEADVVTEVDESPKIAHEADVVTEVDESPEIAHETDVVTEVDASLEIVHKADVVTEVNGSSEQSQVESKESKVEYEKKSFPDDFYYDVPSLDLLENSDVRQPDDDEWIAHKMEILETTFENFGVAVTVTGNYIQGATVTQFEIIPAPGTKVSRIMGLATDLKLSLSVDDLRIEQIPSKSTIGIEIANQKRRIVRLKEVLSSPEFVLHESPLYIGLGEDITGSAVYTDILTMPHGLIAGQTGSGKSVCINTILVSILCKAKPDDVRLMLIDPKRVEMAPYNDIPHLVTPVITDEKKAATALAWAVDEMERRYELFAKNGVRDIKTFNKKRHAFKISYEQLPYIVIIIDELADLMMVAATDVEDCIMRLTQKARAAGIHLIVATQRPTVNVVTGTIKSNIPTRIAFAVAQANDSRVILDENGAENLLGYGDMLIAENGSKTRRVQGSYVDDEEVERVVEAAKLQAKPRYLIAEDALDKRMGMNENFGDPLERDAIDLFIEKQTASTSLLQRNFRIGYNRAARIIDNLEAKGWISTPIGGASKRDVLITSEELSEIFDDRY
jgi:S-DNA-T family DNA segregation ATPase FtsK/SpoIIIE